MYPLLHRIITKGSGDSHNRLVLGIRFIVRRIVTPISIGVISPPIFVAVASDVASERLARSVGKGVVIVGFVVGGVGSVLRQKDVVSKGW